VLAPDDRQAAHDFLLSHLELDGVRTFMPNSGIQEFIQASPSFSMLGWTSPHPDVTAAAINSGVFKRNRTQTRVALQNLIVSQDRAGVLPAYWWRPPYYTGALTLRAFSKFALRPPDATLNGLRELLDRKQLQHGGYGLGAQFELDPLSTALALECHTHLGSAGNPGRMRAAAEGLALAQRPDGEWRGDFVLRIPAPYVLDPREVSEWSRDSGGGNAFVPDRHGIFATALSCHALALYLRVEAGDYAGIEDHWPVVEIPGESPPDDVEVVANTWADENEECEFPLHRAGISLGAE
jgi:hypothetical protein